MKKILFFSFIIFLVSCSQPRQQETFISGKLSNCEGKMLFLGELLPDGIKPVDSLKAGVDGSFTFHITPGVNTFYILKTDPDHTLVLVIRKGEQVRIAGGLQNFPADVTISGSEESSKLHDFYLHTQMNRRKADSLQADLLAHQYDPDFPVRVEKTDPLFLNIWNDQAAFEKQYIRENPSSLSSLIVVNYAFGPRAVLSLEENSGLYRQLDSVLLKLYPKNPHVLVHHKRVEDFRSSGVAGKPMKP